MSPSRKRKTPHSLPEHQSNCSYDFETINASAPQQGRHAFEWLISPVSLDDFFRSIFEKQPKLLSNPAEKFHHLISIPQMEQLVCSGKLQYGHHVDVTLYTHQKGRKSFNGTASCGKKTWGSFQNRGCSIRLLRPQEHIEAIYRLCAHLEAFVECVVGANVYLTPANSQGFAPHFDDVDAFICQVRGNKRWRVYKQREDGFDKLPRRSSVDFEQAEVQKTGCAIDVVLEEGDVLYLPRGYVHQAETSDVHSIHVTISMFQRRTWADILLRTFEKAVESAAAQDFRLRQTLPLRFASFMGASNGNESAKKRQRFQDMISKAMKRVADHYPVDAAADVLAEDFLRERLPPVLTDPNGSEPSSVRLESVVTSKTDGGARVVMGDDGFPVLVHCHSNSKASGGCRGTSSTCLSEEAFAVDKILKAYPHAVRVEDVALENKQDRIDLVEGLLEMGILTAVHR